MRDLADIIKRYHVVIASINRVDYAPIVPAEGRGPIIRDITGREYIDLSASAAVMTLGYAHPRIIEAAGEALRRITHSTHMYGYVPETLELAEELARITPVDRPKVSFGLSGNDANEGALLLAKAYTGKEVFIAYENSFHGVGAAAASVSGIGLEREVVAKIGPWARTVFVPYPNCYRSPYPNNPGKCVKHYLEPLKEALDEVGDEAAALVLEPIQGDGGIIVPPDDYFPAVFKLVRDRGAIVIDDEVQTCVGRTGRWYAIEHHGLRPDVVAVGKGLGGGLPISAIIGREGIMESLPPLAYTFTLAGNPVTAAAALAVIREVEEKGLVKRAAELGERALQYLRGVQRRHNLVGDVRGRGLMIGVELVKDKETKKRAVEETKKVVWRAHELGLIVLFVAGNVLRIQPPLNIDWSTLEEGLARLEQAIEDVEEGRVGDEALKHVQGW